MVGLLGNVGGPFAAGGYEFTMEPIGVFVCNMVSNIIPTNIFQQGSSIEPKMCLL